MAAMKSFVHELVVTIGHTNMQKSVYWCRYAEWFGEARERFLLELINMSGFLAPKGLRLDEVLEQQQIALETASFSIDYLRPAYFGDVIATEYR